MLYLLPAGWNTESPPNLQLRPESVKEFVFVFVIVCVFKWVFVFLYLYLSLYFSEIQFSFFHLCADCMRSSIHPPWSPDDHNNDDHHDDDDQDDDHDDYDAHDNDDLDDNDDQDEDD